jgi:hypothetical protein
LSTDFEMCQITYLHTWVDLTENFFTYIAALFTTLFSLLTQISGGVLGI